MRCIHDIKPPLLSVPARFDVTALASITWFGGVSSSCVIGSTRTRNFDVMARQIYMYVHGVDLRTSAYDKVSHVTLGYLKDRYSAKNFLSSLSADCRHNRAPPPSPRKASNEVKAAHIHTTSPTAFNSFAPPQRQAYKMAATLPSGLVQVIASSEVHNFRRFLLCPKPLLPPYPPHPPRASLFLRTYLRFLL